MKIDHLVVNVDPYVYKNREFIQSVLASGLPYKPAWGKATRGFKVANLWIGREYFEFVHIKRTDGGGWIKDWTAKYLQGHRGLIGFALEVDDIEAVFGMLKEQNIAVTPPEPLTYRWFFGRLTKTMPWRNAYLPPLSGVPLQFFLQHLNDEKSKRYMEQYMVPNSRDNGIEGISEIIIHGQLSEADKRMLRALFPVITEHNDSLTAHLGAQTIRFVNSCTYSVEVLLACQEQQHALKTIEIGSNLRIQNRPSLKS